MPCDPCARTGGERATGEVAGIAPAALMLSVRPSHRCEHARAAPSGRGRRPDPTASPLPGVICCVILSRYAIVPGPSGEDTHRHHPRGG